MAPAEAGKRKVIAIASSIRYVAALKILKLAIGVIT
jgi:hypothetical protein